MRNPAQAQFWRAEAESVPLVPIPYRAVFSAAQFATIRAGLVPYSMDDKWFVLFEDHHLLFFRSWTGRMIYRVSVELVPTGARVIQAEVLDNPDLYERGSIEYEATLLSAFVRRLLLHEDVQYPARPGQLNN